LFTYFISIIRFFVIKFRDIIRFIDNEILIHQFKKARDSRSTDLILIDNQRSPVFLHFTYRDLF